VLQQINWTIRPGEFWQLKGANGSGKTTLLTMINGDNVKGYGQELYLFGRKKGSGETVWEIKEKIGYLTPSMTDLFVTQHTREEMILSGFKDSIGLYTQPTDLERRTAFDWLQWLGLAHKAKQLFRLLSSGEQRMALIARAMVKHPPLLLLDEPLMGLDEANAQKVIALINRLAAESRSALVYVSHQQEPGLQPQQVLELLKTPNGSVGRVIVC
jgi:molybdate transport system ATP-binding protein